MGGVPRTPVWREHSGRTQDAWRTRVKASEPLHSSREPGPGPSVGIRGAAERDASFLPSSQSELGTEVRSSGFFKDGPPSTLGIHCERISAGMSGDGSVI